MSLVINANKGGGWNISNSGIGNGLVYPDFSQILLMPSFWEIYLTKSWNIDIQNWNEAMSVNGTRINCFSDNIQEEFYWSGASCLRGACVRYYNSSGNPYVSTRTSSYFTLKWGERVGKEIVVASFHIPIFLYFDSWNLDIEIKARPWLLKNNGSIAYLCDEVVHRYQGVKQTQKSSIITTNWLLAEAGDRVIVDTYIKIHSAPSNTEVLAGFWLVENSYIASKSNIAPRYVYVGKTPPCPIQISIE